ncbi:Mitochondrial outer membrane import complex protein metaxin [Thalictrum thalictroides]|uniref:Metaxin n=1 Tax=Thalictrum thalictroides TaxID=46969 RepID=A0A7J6WHT9_THATH|nr:Mitochondrial outer membrane import complex protein metaxin [Thalictrum thalictroides]
MEVERDESEYVLVARKAGFGLPTSCPSCLPVYIYLRLSKVPFDLRFNLVHPDSDQIPYVECGAYVVYNNEKGGVIEGLKRDRIVDLDAGLPSQTIPEWLSTKAMITSWLADAVMYELWLGSDLNTAYKIYYSDLPWPIGKIIHFKQTLQAKQVLGINKGNAERREAEIYRRATMAYEALSTLLGEQKFFLENRPTSLDAVFLGHALFTLHVLPETSELRRTLLEHSNLLRYSENLKMEFLDVDTSSSSLPQTPSDPSSSSAPRKPPSRWRTKPQSKPKKEKTKEEKTLRRRAKYFLATQLIAVLIFFSLMTSSDAEDGGDDLDYDD